MPVAATAVRTTPAKTAGRKLSQASTQVAASPQNADLPVAANAGEAVDSECDEDEVGLKFSFQI